MLVAAAYVFTGLWLSSDGPELVAGAAGAAAVLLFTWTIGHLTHPSSYRIRLWLPVVGVGSQLAAAATLAAAWKTAAWWILSAEAASGWTAGILTTEALAVGTLGTVGRNKYLVGVSGALGTTSYGFAAAWLGWTPQGFVAITSVVGAVLLTVWTAAFLGRRLPERFELWLPTIAVVGHVAGLAVFAVAFLEFDLQQSAGVAAAVLGFEALLSGVVATARRNSSLVDLASSQPVHMVWSPFGATGAPTRSSASRRSSEVRSSQCGPCSTSAAPAAPTPGSGSPTRASSPRQPSQ